MIDDLYGGHIDLGQKGTLHLAVSKTTARLGHRGRYRELWAASQGQCHFVRG